MVFEQAIDRAEPAEEVKQRVVNLIDSITYSVFVYTTRGLFERDKLIFTAQMSFLVSITASVHTEKKPHLSVCILITCQQKARHPHTMYILS